MQRSIKILIAILANTLLLSEPGFGQSPAKRLFGAKALPAALNPAAHGFYTKGCLAGGVAIPVDGPHWQAMRLSRNRRWGHPDLIRILEELSYKASKDGWNGLMVGDISQPRGGPMLTGHRSHQMGLDADIWFNPMPNRRLTFKERENTSAVSVLKRGSIYVDKKRWTRGHTMVLYHAARFPEVERVLVHPGVKKQLCDTVRGDRKWLNKIRPTWGHHYHFHVRIGCPKGSTYCKRQNSTGSNT
ncbi:MAG: penicillin-insensitive murein endopeptidase, partial [Rhizobiaceae bacterium]